MKEALPFFILTVISLLIISLPLFNKLDELPSQSKQRVNTLDGLRGFLAFSVVVNHLDANLAVLKFNEWKTCFTFNGMLGEVGVSVFFMITGFLFWGKLLKSEGSTNWKILYVNRIFRIGPVYYVALFIVLVIVFSNTGLRFVDKPIKVVGELFQWSLLGFHRVPNVNHFNMMRILGVTWTLLYEWLFYFSLFITSFFIRRKLPLVFCISGFILGLVYLQVYHPLNGSISLFFSGMLCATLKHNGYLRKQHTVLSSILALLCICSVFIFFNTSVGVIQVILLSVFFYLVANGADLFGLLSLRGAHRFGNISYSLYLLHMSILYLCFNIPYFEQQGKNSELLFWAISIPCVMALLIISSICYLYVEKGGINLGRRVIQKYFNSKCKQNLASAA